MNGAAPYGQPPALWQEHQTPDGRTYYYNPATKVTQWTKPEDMMSPAERALANQPWKEYTAEGGRKYWYNTETKQSSWEMPDVYKNALGASDTPNTPAQPSFDRDRGHDYRNDSYRDRDRDYRDRDRDRNRDRDRDLDRDIIPESRQIGYGDPAAKAFVPASNDPEYATLEEAEAAFMKLLKRSGVQPDWTWEDTIRAVARDPQYRAIKDPKDRRLAFEKYCNDVITQDKERAQERMSKLRADFETMLKRHPEIKHYTRWKTARPMIEGETIFRSTNSEAERRQLFEEYIVQLKRAHNEQQTTSRKSAMDGLVELLPTLNLEPYTRWSDARGIISTTKPFQHDEKYQSLSNFDILTAFQNHMKALERRFNDSKQEEKNTKFRKERKARDAFLDLLSELRKQGKINAITKWHRFLPLIENDERYKAMAGQPGSTPQELFWDVIEEEERALRGPRNDVLDALDDERFDVSPSTSFDDFLAAIKKNRRAANIDRETLVVIFEKLKEKKSRRPEEEKRPERSSRRAVDDFRAYLKRIEPPIAPNDPWEKIKPRCVDNPAFQALPEDAALGAFEKHIRRLRDKEEDAERDRRRRRDHASSERDLYRDRERDRSRGERSHRGSGRGGRRSRSRSPEVDAYEADRRKAIAERERNHRKSTMAESFLSERERRASPPPRRDRERDRERDRDIGRDYDRPPRSRRDDDGYYDRDRRDREDERERLFRRRVGSYDELPYGDERPSGSRRRREDDDEDRRDSRDSKRLRREKTPAEKERTPARETRQKNKTPPPPATAAKTEPKAKEEAVHSGSEEGEIEED